jgi:hypothetical protein
VNRLAALAVAGAAALTLAACGSGGAVNTTSPATSPAAGTEPGVTTYLCSGSGWDDLLQWRDDNGHLSGTYEEAELSGTSPSEQVSSNSGSLSGTLDGNQLTLSIGSSQDLYGTVSGGQLSLNVPQSDGSMQAATCDQSSLSDWNSVVSALDSRAGGDNQQANQAAARVSQQASQAAAQQSHDSAVNQDQQTLASDVSTLENDSSSLNGNKQLGSDINQMKQDYQTEQNDYQTEQQQGSCSDGSMGSDAAQVSSDSAQVDSDLASLNSDIQSLQGSDIPGIKNDMAAVNGDVTTLQGLGATPGTDTSPALLAGNKAVSNANAAIQWAQGQGNSIDSQAHQLSSTAASYANSRCGAGTA